VKHYYEVLVVHHDATQEEIKHAYWDLARVHHPDVGGDISTFVEIVEAYNVLIHPNQRKKYDGKLSLTMDVCHVCKGAGAKYHPRTNKPTLCKECRGTGHVRRGKETSTKGKR
jgi:DnaJ-class molecular chaperone